MDILYHIDEQYLQGVEELNYGELPKALHIFNTIIESDPAYARAHFQIGHIYCYDFKNYQTAGYHFKKCIEFDPEFPDVYIHYLKLLITLKMHNSVKPAAEKALLIPGVCETCIFEALGNYAESLQDLSTAKEYYQKAVSVTVDTGSHSDLHDHLKRVSAKLEVNKKVVYAYSS